MAVQSLTEVGGTFRQCFDEIGTTSVAYGIVHEIIVGLAVCCSDVSRQLTKPEQSKQRPARIETQLTEGWQL